MLLKLAWRNLWRQKRRTVITASALALALLLSLVMRAIQEGSYSSSIENITRLSTGLIQLQHPLFKENQSINELLPGSLEFIKEVKNDPRIQTVLPRINSFALAAFGTNSKGVMIQGIDPVAENNYSQLADKLTAGRYLTEADNSTEAAQILMTEGLAKQLEVKLGDEVILYGQGYHGQTAAGLYYVQGILYFPMKELNNQLIYMPIKTAQQFYSTGDLLTSWVLHTRSAAVIGETVRDLQEFYQHSVKVRDWTELLPDVAQQIQLDRAGGLFLMYLLYGIVGFALFATLLMMTLERQREFAVMLATGMKRSKLLKLLTIESLFIALLGITVGLLITMPILVYLYFYPIQLSGETAKLMLEMGYLPVIPVLLAPYLFLHQVIIVLFLLLLSLVYPLWRIYKLDIVSALKGGVNAA